MPAPVTTRIFLHFATDKERSESARLVEASAFCAAKSRVMTVMAGGNFSFTVVLRSTLTQPNIQDAPGHATTTGNPVRYPENVCIYWSYTIFLPPAQK